MADEKQGLDTQLASRQQVIPDPVTDTRAMTVLADSGAPGMTSPAAVVTSVKRSVNATPYAFRDLLALEDFQRHAKRHLPPMVYQYVAGAVETSTALRTNASAYQNWSFVPRRMVDTSARTAATTLFGKSYSVPFGIAEM